MIVTELYNGQGLGNQLWCYFVTRIIADKNGYQYGIMHPERFKGKEFMTLDFGLDVIGGTGREGGPPISLPNDINHYQRERMVRHPNGIDITKLDNALLGINDNTKIDGIMQSIHYLEGYRDRIKNWIKIHEDKKILEYSQDDVCIIHIRGGDFTGSSAILMTNYYENAINHMKNRNNGMKFFIITDDVNYSKSILSHIEIIGGSTHGNDSNKASHHNGGPIWMDFSILSNAKNSILSASSFAWWPTWLNDEVYTIAPKYWADHKRSNGYWSCGDSLINGWDYMDKEGYLHTYDVCVAEKEKYELDNRNFWN